MIVGNLRFWKQIRRGYAKSSEISDYTVKLRSEQNIQYVPTSSQKAIKLIRTTCEGKTSESIGTRRRNQWETNEHLLLKIGYLA